MPSFIFNADTSARGCYHNININSITGMGARLTLPDAGGADYPLVTPTAGTEQKGGTGAAKQDSILVTGVSYAQKEKRHIVQCFNNTNHVYAFGHDPVGSYFRVEFLLFLTAQDGKGPSNALTRSLSYWAKSRLSKSLKYATLTLNGAIMKGYLVGTDSATRDVMVNLQQCTYDFMVTEVQGGT